MLLESLFKATSTVSNRIYFLDKRFEIVFFY